MSLLAVQGGATGTGTVTILAPVTNTNRTLTLPDATDTVAGIAATQTLTNKTLTTPVISSITNTGTLTLPTSTDTLVGRATTDTLTNKTLTSPTLTTPALGTPASGILTSCTGVQYDGFKNRIINGAMVIDQRNAGASVSGTTGVYTVDRWTVQNNSGSARFNVQQNVNSVTPPAGYKYYLGVTSTSAYSVTATDVIGIQQFIEGYNIADLAWGTASAETITLSFWVRSSLTGTFGGSLIEGNTASAFYAFTYTISTANTWEQKTVTIAGPTIGTWNSTNGRGVQVLFDMGVGTTFQGAAGSWTASNYYAPTGATSVVATNGATWYVTGVQFELGSTATSFDYRPFGTELALCQRYFTTSFQNSGTPASPENLSVNQTGAQFINCNSVNAASVNFTVPMRTAPTILIYAPLTSPAVGRVRKSVDGFIFTNGAASFIGERSFFPSGGDANNPFQYGWVASAEL